MSNERIQPGGRVNKEVYERFKDFVERRHGAVRGNLGTELEKAMKARMADERGDDQLTRIEDDVASARAMLAELTHDTESDGGTTTPALSGAEVRAHADADTKHTDADHDRDADDDGDGIDGTDATKPAPNQPRGQKVDWMVARLRRLGDTTGYAMTRETLAKTIQDWYGFDGDTVDWYVEQVFDRVDAEPSPKNPAIMAWGDVLDQHRAETHDDADDDSKAAADRLTDDDVRVDDSVAVDND